MTVSALIHYFTLVTWMWMGAEAVLMFQKVVIVFFHITTRYILMFHLFAGVSASTSIDSGSCSKTLSCRYTSLSLQYYVLFLWSFYWQLTIAIFTNHALSTALSVASAVLLTQLGSKKPDHISICFFQLFYWCIQCLLWYLPGAHPSL